MVPTLNELLTPAQIEVCALFVEGRPISEIADMTDRSPRTVKELRRRAKRRVESAQKTWPQIHWPSSPLRKAS